MDATIEATIAPSTDGATTQPTITQISLARDASPETIAAGILKALRRYHSMPTDGTVTGPIDREKSLILLVPEATWRLNMRRAIEIVSREWELGNVEMFTTGETVQFLSFRPERTVGLVVLRVDRINLTVIRAFETISRRRVCHLLVPSTTLPAEISKETIRRCPILRFVASSDTDNK
jgi:hypothetical protein